MSRPAFGPRAAAAAAVIVLCGAWLLTGVRVTEIVLFVAYEVGFVLVPGMVLYAVLAGARRVRPLEYLVLGYALGTAVELAMFTITAALHHRGWLVAYPIPFYVGAGVAVGTGRWKLRAGPSDVPGERGKAWLWAGCASLAIVWLTLGFFISNPLARSVDSVAYDQDLVYHLALAAEAKHHWPINDPNIAGDPLRYHTFPHRDMAAISQVTGIPLDVLLLRLWPVAMLLAIAGGIVLLTRRLGGSPAVALLALALLLFAGELDADTKLSAPFLGGAVFSRLSSPGYLLGLVFFLPALYALLNALRLSTGLSAEDGVEDGETSSRTRWLLVLALLLSGAAGAKASVLPVVLGGVGLFVVGDLVVRRQLRAGGAGVIAVVFGVFVASYLLLFRGNSGGLSIDPLHYGQVVAPTLSSGLGGVVGELGLVGMLAPLMGVVGLVAARGKRLPAAYVLLGCIAAASLIAFMLLESPGASEVYFLLYGYVAVIPLSAMGFAESWARVSGARATKLRWLAVGCGGVLAAFVVGAIVLRTFSEPSPVAALITAWALVAVAVAAATAGGARRFPAGRRLSTVVGLALPLLLVVAFLDFPVDTGSRLSERWSRGDPAWHESIPGEESGMTTELRDGLLWLRDNTPESAIVASNNVFISPGFARYFYYAAFGERPTYIGGWQYSERGVVQLEGKPVPPELIQRVEAGWAAAVGVPAAIDALRADGVDYLIVDKLNGQYADTAKLDERLKPSFANDAVAVYALDQA